MGIKLTPEQKDEIRKLTQRANRHIKAIEKETSKHGLEIAPRPLVGDYQVKDQWETKNNPLSRTVKFESEKEYRERLATLKDLAGKGHRGWKAEVEISHFNAVEIQKTVSAIESSIGAPQPELAQKLQNMSIGELRKFWATFEEKANRKGVQYSSESVMAETLQEFFPEDVEELVETNDG